MNAHVFVLFSDVSERDLSMLKNMYFWLGTARSYRKENVETGASELARSVKLWKSGTQRSCWNKASGSKGMGSLGILLHAFLSLNPLSPWADTLASDGGRKCLFEMPVWWKAGRGDGENTGAQFNLCVINSGKRKEPGPSPVCCVFLLNLSLRLADQKALYSSFWKEHIFEGHPVASL